MDTCSVYRRRDSVDLTAREQKLTWEFANCIRYKGLFHLLHIKHSSVYTTLKQRRCFFFQSFVPIQEEFYLLSEKMSTLKRKNLLPKGSKFFPLRVDLFQKGIGCRKAKT